MVWKSLLAQRAKYDYKNGEIHIIIAFLELLIKKTVYLEKSHGFE